LRSAVRLERSPAISSPQLIQARVRVGFPWGTFAVNVTGRLVLGAAATLRTERVVVHPNWRLLIPIGFSGAYTTFSTFDAAGAFHCAYETFRAISHLLKRAS
jgi:fluoride exporter